MEEQERYHDYILRKLREERERETGLENPDKKKGN